MTLPKFITLYCDVCGTKIGQRSGEGAVTGLRCPDPFCSLRDPAKVTVVRDGTVSLLFNLGYSAPKIAAAFDVSRQRVYQIVDDYARGR